MLKRKIKVLNTTGEKINTNSASSCSSINRYDLTAVAKYGEGRKKTRYYIVNNYTFSDEGSYFTGDYIEVNKDLFYLSTGTYSLENKEKLFGPNTFIYDEMLQEISDKLKPYVKDKK